MNLLYTAHHSEGWLHILSILVMTVILVILFILL